MNFCLAWLYHWLHACLHRHLRVHLHEDGGHHYLVCGCGRVFWPLDWREIDDRYVARLNRAHARRAGLDRLIPDS